MKYFTEKKHEIFYNLNIFILKFVTTSDMRIRVTQHLRESTKYQDSVVYHYKSTYFFFTFIKNID